MNIYIVDAQYKNANITEVPVLKETAKQYQISGNFEDGRPIFGNGYVYNSRHDKTDPNVCTSLDEAKEVLHEILMGRLESAHELVRMTNRQIRMLEELA